MFIWENAIFFDSDFFSYESNRCFWGVDTTNISPGGFSGAAEPPVRRSLSPP